MQLRAGYSLKPREQKSIVPGGAAREKPRAEPNQDARSGDARTPNTRRAASPTLCDGIILLTPSVPLSIAMPLGDCPLSANLPAPTVELASKFLELLSLKRDEIGQKFERLTSWDSCPNRGRARASRRAERLPYAIAGRDDALADHEVGAHEDERARAAHDLAARFD